MISLNQSELEKFAVWCEQQAKSSKLMAEQTEKLQSTAMTKQLRLEVLCYTFVAKILRTTEIESIG